MDKMSSISGVSSVSNQNNHPEIPNPTDKSVQLTSGSYQGEGVPFKGSFSENSGIPIAVHAFINHAVEYKINLWKCMNTNDRAKRSYIKSTLKPLCKTNENKKICFFVQGRFTEMSADKLAFQFIKSYLKSLKTKLIDPADIRASERVSENNIEDIRGWLESFKPQIRVTILGHFMFFLKKHVLLEDRDNDESLKQILEEFHFTDQYRLFKLNNREIKLPLFRALIKRCDEIFEPSEMRCADCYPMRKQFGLDYTLQPTYNGSEVSKVITRSYDFLSKNSTSLMLDYFFDNKAMSTPLYTSRSQTLPPNQSMPFYGSNHNMQPNYSTPQQLAGNFPQNQGMAPPGVYPSNLAQQSQMHSASTPNLQMQNYAGPESVDNFKAQIEQNVRALMNGFDSYGDLNLDKQSYLKIQSNADPASIEIVLRSVIKLIYCYFELLPIRPLANSYFKLERSDDLFKDNNCRLELMRDTVEFLRAIRRANCQKYSFEDVVSRFCELFSGITDSILKKTLFDLVMKAINGEGWHFLNKGRRYR